MMNNEYPTFLHRWFEEVWNNKSEDAIDEMLAADVVGYGLSEPDGSQIVGPESFKRLHRAFISAFPDIRITVEDTVTEGNKIAGRCRVTGTHDGEGVGVAPTRQNVDFTGMIIVYLKDGKMIEVWNEFNFMDMYTQVGALTLDLQQPSDQ